MKKTLLLATGLTVMLPSYAQAKTCNVIVSSTKSLENAQKIQNDYASKFDNVNIVKNKKGWFMVSVAEIDKKIATKTVKQWKKENIIPQDSLYSCHTYQKISTATTSKKEAELPLEVTQFNQASANYGNLKKAFIDFYNRTVELQAKEKTLTKEEQAEYKQRVQALKKDKLRLSTSFDVMANLYARHTKILTSAAGGDKVLPYLQHERAFVLDLFKRIDNFK
ncbi:Uncharacterised protein [Phocoenobacter uteri]|uniref:Uncharacterized protein n=1 Tax=Phocoenobacter uteri TaxID=146806 RepID=A0A379CB79_9PAST|nr:hypothetical protein [Phocoenobacter uteri]MDG6881513.1 hypothetical protein [Phocoenobacter uteri]SUB59543.1 Uncharacterised protein [Phocoenobacter uteri]